MELTIYTLGNFDFTSLAFRALQMAFDVDTGEFGVPNAMLGVALVLSFFTGALQGIFDRGFPDFKMLITGYVFWLITFVPRIDVILEHPKTGDVAYYPQMPAAIAIGGSVATGLPYAFLDTLEDLFVSPRQAEGGQLDALRVVTKLEGVGGRSEPYRAIGSGLRTDLSASFDNYINDCYYEDLRMNYPGITQADIGSLYKSSTPLAELQVDATAWFTQVKINTDSFRTVTCQSAYTLIANELNNASTGYYQAILSQLSLTGLSEEEVDNAIIQLGIQSLETRDIVTNNFIAYHHYKNAQLRTEDEGFQYYLADYQEFQAKSKRIVEQSSMRQLWLEMAPALITIMEVFAWFCTPLASFMIVFGGGLKTATGFVKILLLVGLYPVVAALIDFYLDWSIQRHQFQTASLSSGDAFSIGGLNTFYTTASSYVANASMMYTFIPLLAFIMLKGGEYAMVSMANRLGGGGVNAAPLAPQLAPNVASGSFKVGLDTFTRQNGETVRTTSGLSDIGMTNMSGVAGISSSINSSQQALSSAMMSSQQQFSTSYQQALAHVRSSTLSGSSASGERANYSEASQFQHALTRQYAHQNNLSYDEAQKVVAKAGFGARGKGGVFGAEANMTLSKDEKESMQKAIQATNQEMKNSGSDFQVSSVAELRKAFSSNHNDNSAFAKMWQAGESYSESKQRMELNNQTLGATRGMTINAPTNLSAAAYSGGRMEKFLMNNNTTGLSSNDLTRAITERAKYFDGNRDMASAEVWKESVARRQQRFANEPDFDKRIHMLGSMATEFKSLGKEIGEQNLEAMGNNLTLLQSKLVSLPELPAYSDVTNTTGASQVIATEGANVGNAVTSTVHAQSPERTYEEGKQVVAKARATNEAKAKDQHIENATLTKKHSATVNDAVGNGPDQLNHQFIKQTLGSVIQAAHDFIPLSNSGIAIEAANNGLRNFGTLSSFAKKALDTGLSNISFDRGEGFIASQHTVWTSPAVNYQNAQARTEFATFAAMSMPGQDGKSMLDHALVSNGNLDDNNIKKINEFQTRVRELATDNPTFAQEVSGLQTGLYTPEQYRDYISYKAHGRSSMNEENLGNVMHVSSVLGDNSTNESASKFVTSKFSEAGQIMHKYYNEWPYTRTSGEISSGRSQAVQQLKDPSYSGDFSRPIENNSKSQSETAIYNGQNAKLKSLVEHGSIKSEDAELVRQSQSLATNIPPEQLARVENVAAQHNIQLSNAQRERIYASKETESPQPEQFSGRWVTPTTEKAAPTSTVKQPSNPTSDAETSTASKGEVQQDDKGRLAPTKQVAVDPQYSSDSSPVGRALPDKPTNNVATSLPEVITQPTTGDSAERKVASRSDNTTSASNVIAPPSEANSPASESTTAPNSLAKVDAGKSESAPAASELKGSTNVAGAQAPSEPSSTKSVDVGQPHAGNNGAQTFAGVVSQPGSSPSAQNVSSPTPDANSPASESTTVPNSLANVDTGKPAPTGTELKGSTNVASTQAPSEPSSTKSVDVSQPQSNSNGAQTFAGVVSQPGSSPSAQNVSSPTPDANSPASESTTVP
ncbi:conjugal transfer protein TraG N-terminal domain-containing protein, partial [Vibrio maritimus]